MCSGACIMARISKVVYAVEDKKMGFLGGALKVNEVETLNHRVEVQAGVLRAECLEMLKSFFAQKRLLGENQRQPQCPKEGSDNR